MLELCKSIRKSMYVQESHPVSPPDKVQERLPGAAAGSHANTASESAPVRVMIL